MKIRKWSVLKITYFFPRPGAHRLVIFGLISRIWCDSYHKYPRAKELFSALVQFILFIIWENPLWPNNYQKNLSAPKTFRKSFNFASPKTSVQPTTLRNLRRNTIEKILPVECESWYFWKYFQQFNRDYYWILVINVTNFTAV